MSQVVVGLSGKSDAEVVEFGANVHTKLTGNPYVPTADPPLTELETLITDANTKIAEYIAAKTDAAAKKEARDNAIAALKVALTTEAHTVEVQTGGDAEQILTTGYRVKSSGSPVGVPDQVKSLDVTANGDEGKLKATWKKVRGALSYEIHVSVDPITPTSWVAKATVTKTKAELNSFTSGQKMWIRVRAIGAGGDGTWSDPAAKVVP